MCSRRADASRARRVTSISSMTGSSTELVAPGDNLQAPVFANRWALPFLGLACAVGVSSLYYNQPLLLVMGRSLHADEKAMGFVAVATQVGYAAGMLSFVPLGDVAERRALMMRLYAAVSVA